MKSLLAFPSDTSASLGKARSRHSGALTAPQLLLLTK